MQMLVWFCVIFGSFLFIYVVTFDLNSITSESFVLLGISASTALAAQAIDNGKCDPLTDPVLKARQAIEGMGIKTSDQTAALFAANARDPARMAADIVPGVSLVGIETPTVGQICTEYNKQIAGFRSAGLLRDLVNDVNGPTIHRWQIVVWTAVLAAIYLAGVYSNLETPTFGSNLLALMGISGGVYLGFKIPEKQS
jgi:hypothetical protein